MNEQERKSKKFNEKKDTHNASMITLECDKNLINIYSIMKVVVTNLSDIFIDLKPLENSQKSQ